MSLSMMLVEVAAAGPSAQLCPIEDYSLTAACGGGGGGGEGGGGGPPPPTCPAAIPLPAWAFDCQCKTTGRDPAVRCGSALPQATCTSMIDTAYAAGLLTLDAANWLRANGFCPIHYDLGEGDRIYDFCPVGCFASDTQILTDVQSDGKARYSAVSQIRMSDGIMAMTEDASLRQVTLAKQPIDRLVYGPEEPPLYVFALSTGATLKVTQHHPMVLDTGKIVQAEDLDPRARLVGIDGRPVAIMSITRAQATGDVFNFQTATDDQLGHVVVAEGVLVGDLRLQNELAAEDSSIALRR